MASSDSEKLLKFPSLFPIKVVGVAREGFTSEIHACVLDLVPDFDPESLENRLSSKGNYQSVTVRVCAVPGASRSDLPRAEQDRRREIHPLTAAANDDQSPPAWYTAL